MNFSRLFVLCITLTLLTAGPLTGCSSGPDPAMELGGINLGEALDGLLARTQQIMSHVNSIDSAKKANEDLMRLNQDYDDLIYHVPKLSEEGRLALAKKSARALPEMQALANRIHEMPALDDILGETLDTMVENLSLVR